MNELSKGVEEMRFNENLREPLMEDEVDWSDFSDGSIRIALNSIRYAVSKNDEVAIRRGFCHVINLIEDKDSQIPDEYVKEVMDTEIILTMHACVDQGMASIFDSLICFTSDLGHICEPFTKAVFESGLVKKLCEFYGENLSLSLVGLINNLMYDYAEVGPIVYSYGWLNLLSEKLQIEEDPVLLCAMVKCFSAFFKSLPKDINTTDCRIYISNIIATTSKQIGFDLKSIDEYQEHCLLCFLGFAAHPHGIPIMFHISVLDLVFRWIPSFEDTLNSVRAMKLLFEFIRSRCPGVSDVFSANVSVIVSCIRYGYLQTRIYGAKVIKELVSKVPSTADVCVHDGYISIITLHLPKMQYDEKEASVLAFCELFKCVSREHINVFINQAIVETMTDILEVTECEDITAPIRETLYGLYTLEEQSPVHEMIHELFLNGVLDDMPLSFQLKTSL